jgi:uncharacterized membrane protein YhiD involved in acid resistance
MPDFLLGTNPQGESAALHIGHVAIRLVVAAVLGFVVAWVYRRTRKSTDVVASFPTTLVLLCTLIAMVTQVIGESVARAFSLVGALSIVRFRTVVRDTQDAAYVIFAVAVGMAVGAQAPWVGVLGIGVVALTAFVLRSTDKRTARGEPPFVLHIRVPLGYDLDRLQSTLDACLEARDLFSLETAKQGSALDISYEVRLKKDATANELVRALNKVEGVQSVELQKRLESL